MTWYWALIILVTGIATGVRLTRFHDEWRRDRIVTAAYRARRGSS